MFRTRETVPNPTSDTTDRRLEPRTMTNGTVSVTLPGQAEFQAVLVDLSRSGLCIRHWCKQLGVGDELLIQSATAVAIDTPRTEKPAPHRGPRMQARVVWNWAVGPVIITGLQLLGENLSEGLPSAAAAGVRARVPVAFVALLILLLVVAWYAARW